MLVAQLLPFAKNLCTRKWTDEDIIEDVQFLRDELKARFESLTYVVSYYPSEQYLTVPLYSSNPSLEHRTYDEYTSELTSGHLSWTPVHESELFWKENATKLNDKNHEQLKSEFVFYLDLLVHSNIKCIRILIRLLNESTDPTVLAVAAHDLGQYVKHYERGKK